MTKRNSINYASGQNPLPMWRSLNEKKLTVEAQAQRAAEEPGVQVTTTESGEMPLVQLKASSKATDLAAEKADSSDGKIGRRELLKYSTVAASSAALSGCLRRPVEQILPHSRGPEYALPGIALHFASALAVGGDAVGVLVESHEGRPTKIEGNPAHSMANPLGESSSRGVTSMQTQAAILDLYDFDRSAGLKRKTDSGRTTASWSDFEQFVRQNRRTWETSDRVAFLVARTTSPTALRLRQKVRERLPNAVFYVNDTHTVAAQRGAEIAFERPLTTVVDYQLAQVIVSIDCDFLATEVGAARNARLFAEGRKVRSRQDAMSRLYAIESRLSLTGANADNRLPVKPGNVGHFLVALSRKLADQGIELSGLPASGSEAEWSEEWLNAVAADLAAHRGRSAVVVGQEQPAWVHALAHAVNAALGNEGSIVAHFEATDAVAEGFGLAEMVRNASRIDTLFVLGTNPIYDAADSLALRGAFEQIDTVVHLATHDDETSELATWHLPLAHGLETWGDHRSSDGALAIQQPLISPLRNARSEAEVLALIAGDATASSHALVQETFFALTGVNALEGVSAWQQAVRVGVFGDVTAVNASPNRSRIWASVGAAAPVAGDFQVQFVPCGKLLFGEQANNPWLLELPDPITKLCWDNAALLSFQDASRLGIEDGDVIRVTVGDDSVSLPAVGVPGHASGAVTLTLGWGRTKSGRWADGHGTRVGAIKPVGGNIAGGSISKTGARVALAQTQEHHSMTPEPVRIPGVGEVVQPERPLAITTTLAAYRAEQGASFTQRLEPDNVSAPLWEEVDYSQPQLPAQGGSSWSLIPNGRPAAPDAGPRNAWSMVMDLTACTGCSSCIVACNAENNVPVVGAEQVRRGREMHWIRLDRYFRGDNLDNPTVVFQPVACQHCEEAPCENVCPVNATAHSPEGLNEMTYNRCIGTRYCMNNCPYKVRRFNFLAYQGHPSEFQRMQYNPNVSVRMRGVMEKCTYCVQRIQATKIRARNERNRPILDGEVTPACVAACPSQALTFGDFNNPDAQVTRLRALDRHYRLLNNVGAQPRTVYLGRLTNPNEALSAPAEAAHEGHGE